MADFCGGRHDRIQHTGLVLGCYECLKGVNTLLQKTKKFDIGRRTDHQ